jgi:hypothetical protein
MRLHSLHGFVAVSTILLIVFLRSSWQPVPSSEPLPPPPAQQSAATTTVAQAKQWPPDEEVAPPPAHLMPRTPLPQAAVAFLERHLTAGNFSLSAHGRQLHALLLPDARPRATYPPIVEDFEDPRELIELPSFPAGAGDVPATLDEFLPMQASFDVLRQLAAAAPVRWHAPPDDFVPSIGLTCTRHDFNLLLNYTLRLDSVPLGRLVLVVNGRSAIVASLFVEVVHRLVPGFVTGLPLRRNEGVSYAWNSILRTTFVLPFPEELLRVEAGGDAAAARGAVRRAADFVWISNIDLTHKPGSIASTAADARRRIRAREAEIAKFFENPQNDHAFGAPHPLRLLRAAAFAAFLYCASALPVYGYFDETLFPAYGEDIEFQARIRSLGEWPNGVPIEREHLGSAALNRDPSVRSLVGRFDRWRYLKAKWNLSHTDNLWTTFLFKHPFNNPRIPLSAWAIDPHERACIRYGHAQQHHSCQHDLAATESKLALAGFGNGL